MANFKNYTEFELYNSYGKVNLAAPFALFGMVPVVGSFFELCSPEVLRQSTRLATLHLEWQSLPEGDLSEFSVAWSPGGRARLFSKAIRIKPAVIGGSLRFTLVAPSDAFGHQTYASRVAEAALQWQPMPAMPYVPMVKKIWLDYETVD